MEKYKTNIEEYPFQLRPLTISALRTLNNLKYLDVYNNENSYFANDINGVVLVYVYRVIFALTKFIDGTLKLSDNDFIDYVKAFIKEKCKGIGLGDLIKNAKLDLSLDNVERIKDILEYYRIDHIDTGAIGKLCKTTGVLAFFIKDALIFCGLDLDRDKTPNEKFIILKEINELRQMRNETEKQMKRSEEFLNINKK
jgi:hypothetical protein